MNNTYMKEHTLKVSEEVERKIYHAPQIKEYGMIEEITLGGEPAGYDDGFNSMAFT